MLPDGSIVAQNPENGAVGRDEIRDLLDLFIDYNDDDRD